MFLSWLHIYAEIQTNVLARNVCGYDAIHKTAKSEIKDPQLHIYISSIHDPQHFYVSLIYVIGVHLSYSFVFHIGLLLGTHNFDKFQDWNYGQYLT